VIVKDLTIEVYTFTGTRINRTLQLLLEMVGYDCRLDDEKSVILIPISKADLIQVWQLVPKKLEAIEQYIYDNLDNRQGWMATSKWGGFLDKKYQVPLVEERYFDIEGTSDWLKKVALVYG
jgi:ATP-dependent Lhr-like helicase